MKRSYFHQNLALFSATEVSVLTSPLDGSCHTYSTVKERKNQVVALEYENIKNPIDMKSFTLQIKLLKRLFTAKYNQIYIYIYQLLIFDYLTSCSEGLPVSIIRLQNWKGRYFSGIIKIITETLTLNWPSLSKLNFKMGYFQPIIAIFSATFLSVLTPLDETLLLLLVASSHRMLLIKNRKRGICCVLSLCVVLNLKKLFFVKHINVFNYWCV